MNTTQEVDVYLFLQFTHACLKVSCVCGAVLYPLVTHWCWTGTGVLARGGFLDFAGGMVVHGFGGATRRYFV